MKSQTLLLTLVIFFIFYGCSSNKNKTSRTIDNLHVENVYFDFGELEKTTTTHEFSFKLENNGNKTIHINNIESSCSCVVLDRVPKTILANDSSVIFGHIDIKNQKGNISKPIFVDFNDSKVMLLRIIANIK